jgi:hypothetical protein
MSEEETKHTAGEWRVWRAESTSIEACQSLDENAQLIAAITER